MWPSRRAPQRRLLPQFLQLALLVGALIGAYHLTIFVWTRTEPPEIAVPDIVGLSHQEAARLLESAGLRAELAVRRHDEEAPEDAVIGAHPPPGRTVKVGRLVRLTVSSGSRWAVVPDVREMSVERARALLNEARVTLGSQRTEHDDRVPIGYVLRQTPAPGQRVPRGASVDLWLSKGPAPRVVFEQPGAGRLTRSADIELPIPPGAELQEVRIVVTDRDGERTVYRGYHQPGETVRERVSGVGERITIEVFLSGLLVEQRVI